MPGLRIADSAEIGGSLTYTSPAEQDDAIETKPEGGIYYQTPVPDELDKPEAGPSNMRWHAGASPVLRWAFKFAQRFGDLAGAGWAGPVAAAETAQEDSRQGC